MSEVSLEGRVDAYRTLRAQAEASILPLATSLDGRRFSFQARIEGLELALGGYVMLEGGGGAKLGQVRTLGGRRGRTRRRRAGGRGRRPTSARA